MTWSLAGPRGPRVGAAVCLSVAIGVSVASCGESFQPGEGGTTTTTGAGAGGAGGGSSTTVSGTPTAGAGGATSTTTSVGGGGAGAGPPACAHDPCDPGAKLDEACHPCVAAICAQDEWCCNTAWDPNCVSRTWWQCGLYCGAGDTVTCAQQYGRAPNYLRCNGAQGSCRFAIANDVMSCAVACSINGGTCISAELAGCAPTPTPTECDVVGQPTVTCVCSHGCGGGDPCPENQSCTGGVCFSGIRG